MTDFRRTCTRGLAVLGGTAVIAAAGGAVTGAIADAAPLHHTTPACTAHQVHVTAGRSQGGVGHIGFPLEFRNVSHRTCSITGYPGLDAIGAHGRVIDHAKRTRSGYLAGAPSVRTITVRPGRDASAFVEWVDMSGAGKQCRVSRSVEVTVPNTDRSRRLAERVGVCDLQVHPTVAGTSGVAVHRSRYDRARRAWIAGSNAAAAQQDRYLDRAANDLAHAKKDYGTEVRELRRLAGLPETNLTHHQRKQAHELVHRLDRFFRTPKLYS